MDTDILDDHCTKSLEGIGGEEEKVDPIRRTSIWAVAGAIVFFDGDHHVPSDILWCRTSVV